MAPDMYEGCKQNSPPPHNLMLSYYKSNNNTNNWGSFEKSESSELMLDTEASAIYVSMIYNNLSSSQPFNFK